jgi:hypothetical protein
VEIKDWRPFPETTPPSEGNYLITTMRKYLFSETVIETGVARWEDDATWNDGLGGDCSLWDITDTVTAWTELPKPHETDKTQEEITS